MSPNCHAISCKPSRAFSSHNFNIPHLGNLVQHVYALKAWTVHVEQSFKRQRREWWSAETHWATLVEAIHCSSLVQMVKWLDWVKARAHVLFQDNGEKTMIRFATVSRVSRPLQSVSRDGNFASPTDIDWLNLWRFLVFAFHLKGCRKKRSDLCRGRCTMTWLSCRDMRRSWIQQTRINQESQRCCN